MAKPVSLSSLNSGVIGDLFEESLRQVLENIADDNTKADAERKITIEVSLRPNKNRSFAESRVQVKTKLATLRPNEGSVALSYDGSTIRAFTDDPKQEVFENMGNVTPLVKGVVNG